MLRRFFIVLAIVIIFVMAYAITTRPNIGYRVVRTYQQPAKIFNEGMVLDEGILYESSGLYLDSKIIKLDLKNHQVINEYKLPPQYFAEGITIIGDKLYQLTYREHVLFIYDKKDLRLLQTQPFPFEGWGLTTDGKQLIFSNGTAILQFMDPDSLKVTKSLLVKDHATPIYNLNSLQYVDNQIYANVYPTNKIAVISLEDGEVKAWVDLTKINKFNSAKDNRIVANGIAYDKSNKTLLVSGKFWPTIFELDLFDE